MEQRRAERIDTELKVMMVPIDAGPGNVRKPIFADVIDVSKTGIGFMTANEIEDHTYFKARLVFHSKESVDTIIETVRHITKEGDKNRYGGRFVALSESDQFKIEVLRMFAKNKGNETEE
ncbi:MAG: PilZ domain-containing protein [Lachnospiraceae bacterium]|nr:PilZ domain-containing protein [Lachnospiraceae bacterium]